MTDNEYHKQILQVAAPMTISMLEGEAEVDALILLPALRAAYLLNSEDIIRLCDRAEADVWCHPEYWTQASAGAAGLLEALDIEEEHPIALLLDAIAKSEWMIEITLPEEESLRRLQETIRLVEES